MDIEAIAQGDYSSVAGVWQDDKGNKLVFDQMVWSLTNMSLMASL